jgi:hypothetical protein
VVRHRLGSVVSRRARVEIAIVSAAAFASAGAGALISFRAARLAGTGQASAAAVAVPFLAACLLLYVPVRLAARWAWRQVQAAAPDPADRRALALILLVAAGLLTWGMGWGLVGDSWAPDELRPDHVRDALRQGFSNGWYDKYPLMHYMVLGLPVSAFSLADALGVLPADGLPSTGAQLAIMRLASVVMSLGALVAAFLCGAELRGPRTGLFATVLLLLTPVFLYYGKVANLDAPALCWFGLAMVAFLRILRHHRREDYVLLGAAAAAAVATKD